MCLGVTRNCCESAATVSLQGENEGVPKSAELAKTVETRQQHLITDAKDPVDSSNRIEGFQSPKPTHSDRQLSILKTFSPWSHCLCIEESQLSGP